MDLVRSQPSNYLSSQKKPEPKTRLEKASETHCGCIYFYHFLKTDVV